MTEASSVEMKWDHLLAISTGADCCVYKLTPEDWAQRTCVHVDQIFWPRCHVCTGREKQHSNENHNVTHGISFIGHFQGTLQPQSLDSPCNCDVITQRFLPSIQQARTRPGLLTENENTLGGQRQWTLRTFTQDKKWNLTTVHSTYLDSASAVAMAQHSFFKHCDEAHQCTTIMQIHIEWELMN